MSFDLRDFDDAVTLALHSDTLGHSKTAQKLLQFLAGKIQAGRADKISSRLIATELFGLPDTHETEKNPITRVQISRLRALLKQYYEVEGRENLWRLEIPTGQYSLQLVPGSEDQSNFSPRVAVLQLTNIGGDTYQEQLCQGLTKELIHLLTHSRGLRIINTGRVAELQDRRNRTQVAGQLLKTDYVLDGSVRLQPKSYRILIQLTDVKSNQVMWSYSTDIEQDSNLSSKVQGDIATKVTALLVTPTGVIDRLARLKAPDGSAYAAVLRFYVHMENYTPETHRLAKSELLEAVRTSPLYAEAWACLAGVYWNEHTFGFDGGLDNQKALDQSIAAAQQALKLAPDCVTGVYALAVAFYHKGERELFLELAKKTIELAPYRSDLLAGLGLHLAYDGNWEYGLGLLDRARDLNPMHPGWYWFPYVANAYRLGDYKSALTFALKLNSPDFPWCNLFLAVIYANLGKMNEANQAIVTIQSQNPDLIDRLAVYLGRIFRLPEIKDLMLADLARLGYTAKASP